MLPTLLPRLRRVPPQALLLACLGLAWIAIAPWGDYPLNDDWEFADAAKKLAETGVYRHASGVAPSLVGQSTLAAPLIRFLGFSHVLLRLLTMVVACAALLAIDRIVKGLTPHRGVRFLVLGVVAFNPLFLYLATTFMTEIYGYAPGLLGVALWFWNRGRRDRATAGETPRRAAVSIWVAVLTGGLIGISYSIRQFSILMFPPVLIGTVGRLVLSRQWRRLLRSIPALCLATLAFGAGVKWYLHWSQTTNNQPPLSRVDMNLLSMSAEAWVVNGGMLLVYMTAFLAPLLAILPWRRGHRACHVLVMSGCLILGLTASVVVPKVGRSDSNLTDHYHHRLPYSTNVIYDAGVGPITLDDVYMANMSGRPRWTKDWWNRIETVLLGLTVLWSPLLVGLWRTLRDAQHTVASEVMLFGAAFAGITFAASVQAFNMKIFDRYFLPTFLGLVVLVAAYIAAGHEAERGPAPEPAAPPLQAPGPRPWRLVLGYLLLTPIAYFSIAGLHDYFRWNDAAWALFRTAESMGATPKTVQMGYESNGWLSRQGPAAGSAPIGCLGQCQCQHRGFYCEDDSWRIGMNLLGGHNPILSIQPPYWLADGPPMVLSVRSFELNPAPSGEVSATASSSAPDGPAAAAIDGKISLGTPSGQSWQSAGTPSAGRPEELILATGAPVSISGIELYIDPAQPLSDYSFHFGESGRWIEIPETRVENDIPRVRKRFGFPPILTRQLRLTVRGAGGGPARVPEIVLYHRDEGILLAVDNSATLFIDGAPAGKIDGWSPPAKLAGALAHRPIVIALQATNEKGPGGLLGTRLASGPDAAGTPADWRCSLQPEENWTQPDFDDSHWSPPARVTLHGHGPWHTVDLRFTGAWWVWPENPAKDDQTVYCRWRIEPNAAPP